MDLGFISGDIRINMKREGGQTSLVNKGLNFTIRPLQMACLFPSTGKESHVWWYMYTQPGFCCKIKLPSLFWLFVILLQTWPKVTIISHFVLKCLTGSESEEDSHSSEESEEKSSDESDTESSEETPDSDSEEEKVCPHLIKKFKRWNTTQG